MILKDLFNLGLIVDKEFNLVHWHDDGDNFDVINYSRGVDYVFNDVIGYSLKTHLNSKVIYISNNHEDNILTVGVE